MLSDRFPYPQDVVNYSVDRALTHIENDYILRTVKQVFRSEDRDAAKKFLKEQIRYYGSGGPNIPSLDGTPKGIRTRYKGETYTVTWNEILKRALRSTYRPIYKQIKKEVPIKPLIPVPKVDWTMAWADYNVVSRNLDIFPPEMEVKKFVREWERKYGKGIAVMGAPLQPLTVEDAKRMDQYCEYVKGPPAGPRIHATKVDVGKYSAGDYYIMLLNQEKYGDRPILAATRGTIKEVEEYVVKGEEYYDVDELGLIPEPGEEWWEELPEELKHDAEIYWTPRDVEWSPEAEDDKVIYHRKYIRYELEGFRVEKLKRICKVKALETVGRKQELINRILGYEEPKVVEVKEVEEVEEVEMPPAPLEDVFIEAIRFLKTKRRG